MNKRRKVLGLKTKYIEQWSEEFGSKPVNSIIRNAVVSVGSEFASTDSEEVKKVNHSFINTLKKYNLKATNQAYSGRCWLFAGLNTFRHLIIKALDLENFEYSETYLFFWDKLERANYLLRFFIDNPQYSISSREVEYFLTQYMDDGGYWNMFVNLVKKYGVIPKSAMPETFQSCYSVDLNSTIHEYVTACISHISKNRDKLTRQEIHTLMRKTLKRIYNILVKYLGQPPQDFVWFFTIENTQSSSAIRSNPSEFIDITFGSALDIEDFILLSNFPTEKCKERCVYGIKWTSNMFNGRKCQFLNLSIHELKRYAMKSVLGGLPVWFAGDVNRGFSMEYQALNTKLINTELLFGKRKTSYSKGERLMFRNSGPVHAMVILGVNIDEKNKTTEWQIENSWGYLDNQERGLDGFLTMSDEWFDECVFMVVVHKQFLSRTTKKILDNDPIILDPWDSTAPAKVGPYLPRK